MKYLIIISICLATLQPAIGYASGSAWIGAAGLVGLGLLWLAGQRRGQFPTATVGLIAVAAAAAFGVWQGLPAGWMLFGIVAGLAAWDLDHFARRLEQAEQVAGEVHLKRDHLRQLLIVAGLGLLLGGVALGLQVELNLGWAIGLGLLVIIGLSWVIGFGKNDGD